MEVLLKDKLYFIAPSLKKYKFFSQKWPLMSSYANSLRLPVKVSISPLNLFSGIKKVPHFCWQSVCDKCLHPNPDSKSWNYSPGNTSMGNCPSCQLENLNINNLYCTLPYISDLKPWPGFGSSRDIPQACSWKTLVHSKKVNKYYSVLKSSV